MCKSVQNNIDKVEKDKNIEIPMYRKIKSISDITISLLVLPFVLLIIGITGIFIKLDSEGPIIYSQKRIGLNEDEFVIYKLRSMKIDAEANSGSVWASKDDPRITKVGKVIRKFRIDELPQFFNIIKGDMSLIGPRPERKDLTEKFSVDIPNFKQRLQVKPGITGLAQVNGGYDISPKEKLEYDLDYIKNISFITDVKIIAKTIIVLFTGNGAR